MSTGDWIASTVAIIAALGVWTNYVFPKYAAKRRRDGLEIYFNILLGKSTEGLTDLQVECQKIAIRLEMSDRGNIEAKEVLVRTTHLKEIPHERLFDLLILARGIPEPESVESFFKFTDSILRVNHISDAAYRSFAKFDDVYGESQTLVDEAVTDIINFVDGAQAPHMVTPNTAILWQETFELSLVALWTTWVNNNSTTSGGSKVVINNPYVILDTLVEPLRVICRHFPQNPNSPTCLGLLRKFDLAFSIFDGIKKQYSYIYNHYAESLGKLIPLIQSESGALLRRERYDQKIFSYKY
jgi:hypothetical protein